MKQYLIAVTFLVVLIGCKEEEKKNDVSTIEIAKTWKTVTAVDDSKPVARHEAAFVKVADKFYLLGGRGDKPVNIYDPKTQKWAQGTNPPVEMHHFQPVVYKNTIYTIGAMTGGYPSETPLTHVYKYHPDTDTWSQGDEIPEDRRRGSSGNVLYKGHIYIACGIKNGHIGDHKNWLDRYNPETGTWEVLADAPTSRDHFQAVLANDKIYTLAGRNSKANEDVFGNTIGTVDVYDITTNSWSTLTNEIPSKRAGNMALIYDNEILVVGGESNTQEPAYNEVEALDITSNTWRNLPSLVRGRHGTGIIEYNNELYIASGCGNRGGSPELDSMEKFGD